MDNQKDTNNNNPINFLHNKIDKLTQGVYLVSSLLSDNEPLKWKIRDKSLSLLELIKDIKVDKGSDYLGEYVLYKNLDLELVNDNINSIQSLLELAMKAGNISSMNMAIISAEYGKLKELIKQIASQSMSRFVLSGYEESFTKLPLVDDKRQVLGQNKEQYSKPITSKIKDNKETINKTNNSRQQTICNYLKGKSWVSIKDISTSVSDCSLKTIQRELSDMVNKGLLRKKGDRRWSRYTLVS